jgi:hypothetical protein
LHEPDLPLGDEDARGDASKIFAGERTEGEEKELRQHFLDPYWRSLRVVVAAGKPLQGAAGEYEKVASDLATRTQLKLTVSASGRCMQVE